MLLLKMDCGLQEVETSQWGGLLVTLVVAVTGIVATMPYIALQLQSVTLSFGVFASETPEGWAMPDRASTALWVAVGLALFTTLFIWIG